MSNPQVSTVPSMGGLALRSVIVAVVLTAILLALFGTVDT